MTSRPLPTIKAAPMNPTDIAACIGLRM